MTNLINHSKFLTFLFIRRFSLDIDIELLADIFSFYRFVSQANIVKRVIL